MSLLSEYNYSPSCGHGYPKHSEGRTIKKHYTKVFQPIKSLAPLIQFNLESDLMELFTIIPCYNLLLKVFVGDNGIMKTAGGKVQKHQP